ncbi:MAG: photosystem II biogenesis protein Psp29 [Leptolyngbyaceae cyanobacterium RM2_2_4]|nr:photosystem II biogenesis protein Psp29 [Leptolyngbyaceae cyanobacterium SM1_4_3]NJN58055.1 photosystem II biogenesis protein Psp29 [Leptolyngbyaceae cyanobacterium SL_5_9]NJO50930.1 photosystem II biogenesis protein Psp29 [Leptolyngbyaceae cyanobacterium RM2_2_4]NJO72954.1 photosystem II biogenesis protein Psp29 [Leptolyngbyaceae cyanobacterium RM1_406_9]
MNNVRTVSDTKRAFYSTHTRPINSIYRRVVEELMVEMHLLSVNADFRYDPIYALGIVTAFERFMQGYRPDHDKVSIFNALCQSIGDDPQTYRQDFERLRSEVSGLSLDNLMGQLKQSENSESGGLTEQFQAIAQNPKFKYSRLFAIGLYSLLELVDADLVKDEKRRNDALQQVGAVLNLPDEKVQKDLELYRSNLEKVAQAQIVMEDILKADRKKKEEREKAKGAVATPPSNSQEST